MLSVCIITRNEAEKLEKCLQHLKKMKAEIVVVDTGSQDHTKLIIEKYADIAGEFAWCDHFAKAKNYAASLASNDWIFTLDSDEYIINYNQKELEQITEQSADMLWNVQRKNLYESDGDGRISTIWIPRIYNRTCYQYQGRIHEQLRQIQGKEIAHTSIRKTSIVIDHDGYLGTPEQRREKAKRNKRLLLLDLEEFGEEPYTLFQLGKSAYMAEEYAEAAQYFSKGLEFDLDPKLEYVIDMVETYGYALLNSGQKEMALGLESVYDAFGNTADFKFLMGLIYMNNGLLQEAVDEFQKAAQMPEGKVQGTSSYLPYYNMGVIYECTGNKEKAKKCYKKCGVYEKALERIKHLSYSSKKNG